jgi:NAD(P)-dependent dehydrogenase (short-subunit alcohol dehydrogenase family)
MTNRILVTGASGFLGSAVIPRLLARCDAVVGLDPAPPAHAGIRHVEDDLSDPARLCALLAEGQITHVLHAGGVSGPMVMTDRPDGVMAVNVGGSLNLLLAALETDVKTFVYCSSVSAIGDFYEPVPIDEDYPMRPTTPYGCSKAAIDMVLRGLWRKTWTAAAAASVSASTLTSHPCAIAFPEALSIACAVSSVPARSTSRQATAAPALPNASAMARPMPVPAPVTTAIFSASDPLSGFGAMVMLPW